MVKLSIYLNGCVLVMNIILLNWITCKSVGTFSDVAAFMCSRKLTHCILDRFSHPIYRKSPISILSTSSHEIYIFLEKKMAKLFANSGNPDQTPRSAASDLGLHCLQITLLGVSRLQWVKSYIVVELPICHLGFWCIRRP